MDRANKFHQPKFQQNGAGESSKSERLFLGFLKEDLFYFFSKIIFQKIFIFTLLLLCTPKLNATEGPTLGDYTLFILLALCSFTVGHQVVRLGLTMYI